MHKRKSIAATIWFFLTQKRIVSPETIHGNTVAIVISLEIRNITHIGKKFYTQFAYDFFLDCKDKKKSKKCKKLKKKGKCSKKGVWKKCKKTCEKCWTKMDP